MHPWTNRLFIFLKTRNFARLKGPKCTAVVTLPMLMISTSTNYYADTGSGKCICHQAYVLTMESARALTPPQGGGGGSSDLACGIFFT